MKYKVTKRYGHMEGLSCAFRQWRAVDTHCRFIHGYALSFTLEFEGETLDARNWLISFGELKPIKAWLQQMYDHKTLIAADDPELPFFIEMDRRDLIQINIVSDVGCEKVAELTYDFIAERLKAKLHANGARLLSVQVAEHEGNSATYYG